MKIIKYYIYVVSKDYKEVIVDSEHETLKEALNIRSKYVKFGTVPENRVMIYGLKLDSKEKEFNLIRLK